MYAQQQAASASAAATLIQAVWRGGLARQLASSLQALRRQQQQLDRAATAVQVSTAVAAIDITV